VSARGKIPGKEAAMKQVSEVMTPSVFVIEADSSLEDAAKVMRQHNIGMLPVIAQGALLGVLTDRDIVVRAIAFGRDPSSTRVDEIMSGRTVEIGADESVDAAIDAMTEAKVRRLVVADQHHKPIGVLSIDDLAKELGDRPEMAKALHEITLASLEYTESTGSIH